jgi:iron complex outermembrane receptor protein
MKTIKKIILPFVLSPVFLGIAQAAELEVIQVTAKKTTQNINDVSVSVKAFGSEDIDELGLSQPSDLANYTPGLNIKPSVGDQSPVITVRGIGFNDFTSIQNPGAGVYVDQVIVPYHSMMAFQLLDLERVEVLKGPQGTLYGRNSTAGAINFVSQKPTEDFAAKVSLDYSKWDTTDFEVAIGGGLTDHLSARLAYSNLQRNDSFQTNRLHPDDNIGEKDRQAYRLSLLWDDNDTFDALLNIHGGKDKSGQVALEHLGTVDPITGTEPCAPVAVGNRAEGTCTSFYGYFDPDSDPFAGEYSVTNGGVNNDAFGVGLTMNWQITDTLTLTSVTGYDEFERDQLQDIDAGPIRAIDVTFQDETESLSQELRLTYLGDDSTWIGGVFFSDDSVDALQSIEITDLIGSPTTALADVTNIQDSKSKALFINGNFQLTDEVTLLTGLRYTDEEKSWRGGSVATALGVNNLSVQSINDTDLSGLLGVEYRPNTDTLFYGTFSKGYRSGGFPGGFAASPAQLKPFDAENVYAYEAGFKATLLENSFQLNASAYYYDWQDLQTQFSEVRGGLVGLFLTNAGDADIKGLEISFDWSATDNLTFHGGLNLMDTEVSSDDARLDGKVLANAPDLSYNLIADYYYELNDNFELNFGVDVSFTDERFFTSDNEPVFHGDDYLITNARVSLVPTNDSWKVMLWARNITDKEYRVEGFNQFGFSGDSYHAYGEPANFGINFSYEWE